MYEKINSLSNAKSLRGYTEKLSGLQGTPPYLTLKATNGTTFESGTRIYMEVY